jgi:ubiquinone/menaquinone biosynthesis C-methylase UbiE
MDHTIFRCPDCGGTFDLELVCVHCGRRVTRRGNYFELLPSTLDKTKVCENAVFAPDSGELSKFQNRIWRKLIGRLEIERFDKEIVPVLPEGRFLELGGEACWASAIYKSVHPDATVFATDVSPNAIVNIAIPLSRMFPSVPDVFGAIDAEKLPFQDNTFDCIFIESAMHHMPNLPCMLREVRRVLKAGGRFVAVDHSVPNHFRFLFKRTADARSQCYGIREALLSFGQWMSHFEAAGFPRDCLHVYSNTSYIRNPFFALAGSITSFLPDSLNRAVFPVGLYVCYDK